MVKTLILIRHAHRDTSKRELNNGLTDKGREQAKALKRFFTARFGSEEFKGGLWFVSSPKLRCQESLAPLAKAFDRPVDSHPLLDEQNAKEPSGRLEMRVKSFLQEWSRSQAQLTVLCSHGDWLPLATHQLLGLPLESKKGSWLEVEWSSGRAALKWYIPSFKHFYS